MSDTPRTDEQFTVFPKTSAGYVPAPFARELERENAKLKAERDGWKECALSFKKAFVAWEYGKGPMDLTLATRAMALCLQLEEPRR